jgi:sugar phosphate isomerase/epimerase
MQLLMFTKMLAKLDVAALGKTIKELGFDGMDLAVRPGHPVNPENVEAALPEAVRQWADMGLVVGLVTAETSMIDPGDPVAERVFATCARAGVKYVKLGYYLWKPGQDYWGGVEKIRRDLEGFAALGARYGVIPCYHTHSGNFYGVNASALMHLFDGMDPRHIGAYLDAGHLMLDGEPFAMALKIAEPYLRSVAVKDPRYIDRGRKIVPLGEGLVDWPGVCRALKAANFDGPVSLHSEYDMETDQVIATTRKDLRLFRNCMREAGF